MLSELIRQIKRSLASFLKPEQNNFDSRFTGLETKDRIFDECVNRFFKPLAQRIKLPLNKVKDGIYEIRGSAFTMRVRRGTGHSRDFIVCLSENKSRPESLEVDRLDGEIGLGVIAEFYGEKLGMHAMHLNEGYLSAFEEAASAAEKLCIPYLLDLRTNYNEIRGFIEKKIEESGIRTKKYNFPKNVRQEWL